MLKLLPYNRFSKSAKALARRLGVKRIVSPGYRQRREVIVNWGTSNPTQRLWGRVLNVPHAVNKAADKLLALQAMQAAGVPTVDYTTSLETASTWLTAGKKVVCRHLLRSHSGNGARVVKPGEVMPYAPLYTQYFARDAEYRVHVFNRQVIDFVRKKRRNGFDTTPGTNEYIRTHQFGWVFCRDGIDFPECVRSAALRAVSALGLDFGACDILYRDNTTRPVAVLEVNTAPGLEGTTLEKYTQAIRGIYA